MCKNIQWKIKQNKQQINLQEINSTFAIAKPFHGNNTEVLCN
jgi:hypothetical protein